jgi:hypothetical protein
MAIPNSRQSVIDYCLRNLGEPVLEINVSEEQIEDRIDEALQFYQEYHSDAISPVFHKHQVTAQDIQNEYITIPDAITVVTRIFSLAEAGTSSGMFSAKYQIFLNDIFDLRFAGSIANYVQTMQYLNTLDMVFNGEEQIRFNRHMGRLHIDTDWSTSVQEGSYIIVEAYRIVDPNTFSKVYNDMFLKRYATALIKRNWGQNLSKFDGMQLPGGVQINAQRILEEANAEIIRIEEEMQLKYEYPPSFFVG